MFKKKISILLILAVILAFGYAARYAAEDDADNTETVPAEDRFDASVYDAGVAFIRDHMLYFATRTDGTWTEVETGVVADSVSVWNDDVLATAVQTPSDDAHGRSFSVTVDIRDPETYVPTAVWERDGIATYRVSRNGTQIIYTDSNDDLYLYSFIDDETKLLDTGVRQSFDDGITYPLTWNEDLAQLMYTAFDVKGTAYTARGSYVYDLATDRKRVVSEIAGRPVEAFFEENGDMWVYYIVMRNGVRQSLRRLNMHSLQDEAVPTGPFAPFKIWVRGVSDPWYYGVAVDGRPFYDLVRADQDKRTSVINNVSDFAVRENNELLVAIPKHASSGYRLVAADAEGRNQVMIADTIDASPSVRSFVWKTE